MQDTKNQLRRPIFLEERDDSESSSQVEILTETQSELIGRISNKQLASRLHKRTLKIFKREERLNAIEYYRTHVHIDPQTGEERGLSIASAAEALHISSGTLERWINEEKKILSMKHGSSRDDSDRWASVPVSERFKSGNYPFLKLTPRQLFARNYIKGKDFYKLHPLNHPVPFIGIEGGRRGKIESFADAYRFLGHDEDTVHYGHPLDPSSNSEVQPQINPPEATTPGSKISSELAPRRESATIQKLNARLYHLAPDYSLRQLGIRQTTRASDLRILGGENELKNLNPCQGLRQPGEQLRACVSLVCEQFVTASDKLESAMPIRIEFDYDKPFEGAPTHWAIKLLLKTTVEILLPLSLCLRGSIKHEVVPDTLLLQGWTMDYEILKCKTRKRQRYEEREIAIEHSREFYLKSRPIFEKCKLSPVLYIEDVEMLFVGSQSWRPRRFSPTWTLYSTFLHSSYRSGGTLTPIYGKYTDIDCLVGSVITTAPHVSFSGLAVQPFQLVSLAQFSLSPQVSETAILSQFFNHLEDYDTDLGRGLKLDYIEKTLKEDTHITERREFRKKLVHALKLSAQKSLEYVNGEKRCLFYTCPQPQEGSVSYYCRHHSESLINYMVTPAAPLNLPVLHQEQEREINLTAQVRESLQHLKVLYGQPERTWILDFEYISLPKRYSPIPLQIAIRQLDGKMLYQGNINYGLSMKEFMDAISPYVSHKHGMTGTLFLRCYGGLKTNGETPCQVRDKIINVCGYNPDNIKILSWFAAQDMQCFLKILTGSNDPIQDKISHQDHANFQVINIGSLCGKLFPGLLSTTLQSVHEFLTVREVPRGEYHTASYDTEAMATIVQALLKLA